MAALNDEVCSLICNYTKSKTPVNSVHLTQHGLPPGGRKPSLKRKSAEASKYHSVFTQLLWCPLLDSGRFYARRQHTFSVLNNQDHRTAHAQSTIDYITRGMQCIVGRA